MISQRRCPKLSLVIAAALLCGQSAGGQTLRSEQSVRPKATLRDHDAVRRERRSDASEVVEQERAGREEREKEKGEKEERELDDPNGRLEFRRLQLQDENGHIPPDGLEKARKHVERMKLAQKARLQARKQSEDQDSPVKPLAAGIEPDSWEPLGPGNVGGRIRAISIHPNNANDILIGSVSGGIWRTFNGGDAWFPVNDFLANLAVSTLARDPTNPSIIYAGTGEGFGNIDAIQGAGVFRSANGGATWTQLASTNPAASPPAGCGVGSAPCPAFWFFVNRLAVSPNGGVILAATSQASDANGNIIGTGGIARSTDGGATWTQRTNTQAMDIEFLGNDSNRAIVGELGTARFSLNGGQTWTAATFNPAIANGGTSQTNGRVELANTRLFTSRGFNFEVQL